MLDQGIVELFNDCPGEMGLPALLSSIEIETCCRCGSFGRLVQRNRSGNRPRLGAFPL